MRVADWASTPLGPLDGWPQSLRTMVSSCLNSRFPMFVWWGPEMVMLYNDAYRPILGDKHPRSLGQSGREAWSEIWHIIGPTLDAVLERGEASWQDAQLLPMIRRGFMEETYFTYSYSPIRGESGGVEGIFCACAEVTAQVVDARRLQVLRALAERGVGAESVAEACARACAAFGDAGADVPFAAIYLIEPDGGSARLACSAGLERAAGLCPDQVALDGSDRWRLSDVIAHGHSVRVRDLEVPIRTWPEPATSAMVLPISASGVRLGAAVLGLSPRLMVDDGYRLFCDVVADHLSKTVAGARAYAEERQRAEALAEIDRAKTAFFSNVSHEFRTPLTLILGPLQDALAGAGQPALTGEPLRAVQRNTLRLLKLVNTLLDFSRLEAGRVQASYQPTDLAALTADLASLFRSAMERAGLDYQCECPPLPEPIFVDRDMWEKIVLNLLSNAFKFTLAGGVRVRLSWRERRAVLEVSDTGDGIPAAELPHLFERFHRVQGARARTHEGSGIGLALASELVRLHGGTIDVASEPGRGSTFTITIPGGSAHLPAERIGAERTLAPTTLGAEPFVEEALRWLPDGDPPAAGPPVEGVADVPSAPMVDADHACILVADDNADMRDYLRRLLAGRWQLEVVGDGEAALEVLGRQPVDLVITDVMMPRLDGFGLIRAIRALPALSDLPVIMLSARAGEEARVEGLQAGADDYLIKPFSARELVARVEAQIALSRVRRRAALERDKLQRLFMGAPFAVAVFEGPRHRCVLQNPVHRALIGDRDLVGRELVDVVPEVRDQMIMGLFEEVRTRGVPVTVAEVLIPLLRRGAVQDCWFTLSLQPLIDEHGRTTGVMAAGFEVTEAVKARLALVEANRAKDEFLAIAGHELRNPLAPIHTALHLLELRSGNVGRKERAVIARQVEHMTRMVDDLLDVSRIARGTVTLKRERVEIAEIVAKALEVASPLLEDYRHHLTLDVPSSGLAVHGDVTRLTQVVANLLTNAAKYTPSGGHISVTAERMGEQVELSVSDDGLGIAADMVSRVFDLFVQQPQSIERTHGGLGLGLSIVRNLVDLHGGTVAAHSDGLGRGSRFVVQLPIDAAEPVLIEVAAPEQSRPQPGASARVLVVDDNTDAAEVLADTLAAMGYATAVAHDGPSALRIAGEFHPVVVLLDIGLPVMDGYEVARRLRELPDLQGVRLVALTGYGLDRDRARSREAGFDAHLVKPVMIETIEQVMAREAQRGAS
jgi:signal transduction histidine kinase